MIPTLLGGGTLGYAEAAVPLRAAWYVTTLGGAGMAFFALLFGRGLAAVDAARLHRWTRGAALSGVLVGVAGLVVQVGALTSGEALLDAEVWGLTLRSPASISYAVGGTGLLVAALIARGPRWTVVATAGGVLACASYLLLGHTTQASPRPLLALLLLLHLLVAAFWIGSLPPLAWTARRGGPGAARLIQAWARTALLAVGVQLMAGLLLAWLLLGSVEMLVTSRYGWALLAKVGLVALLLGIAAWHRQRLTPALVSGVSGAGTRLACSIWVEAAIAAAVLYAAAELVATSPSSPLRGPG